MPPILYAVYGLPLGWFRIQVEANVETFKIYWLIFFLNFVYWIVVFYFQKSGIKFGTILSLGLGMAILYIFNFLVLNPVGMIYYIILYALTMGIKIEPK